MPDVADPVPEAHGSGSAWRWKSSLLVAETLSMVLHENVPKKLQAYLDWHVHLFRVNRAHERLDPTTKSDVPCAEVRESLSQPFAA